jgi:hypothetical protein
MDIEMKQDEIRPIISAKEIIPLHKDVLVYDMYFGETVTSSGIIVLDDDKKERGIHPRWAKVYAVGSEQKDIIKDQWILIEHGRWSRGIDIEDLNITVRRVDPKAILGTSDTNPEPEKWTFEGK